MHLVITILLSIVVFNLLSEIFDFIAKTDAKSYTSNYGYNNSNYMYYLLKNPLFNFSNNSNRQNYKSANKSYHYKLTLQEYNLIKANVTPEKLNSSKFLKVLSNYPFTSFNMALKSGSKDQISKYLARVIISLSKYVIKEPNVQINEDCKPPPLLEAHDINCSAYPSAFNGTSRKFPAKVAHLIQFGDDVDVLEILLREIFDIVDYVFILESIRTHNKFQNKILTWEAIKHQERFEIFSKKIVHLILDDVESMVPNNNNNIYYMEHTQERKRWERFLEWNKNTKYFGDDDLIGFGDTDEIPSRFNIHLMKHCQMSGPVDIGIWFPMGELHAAFKTDWPVSGNEYTLGDPTFWPLRSAKAYTGSYGTGPPGIPSRMRGHSGKYLLGGMHMTSHPYLPFLLLKYLTCGECLSQVANKWWIPDEINNFIKNSNVHEMELYFSEKFPKEFQNRLTPINKLEDKLKDVVVLPWFYFCNRDRYGYWEKQHDTRLD